MRSVSIASNVLWRASVASCNMRATPELPAACPSSGAAYKRRKRGRGNCISNSWRITAWPPLLSNFESFSPFQLWDKICHGLSFDIRLQPKQACYRLVKIENTSGFIHHQDTIFNGIKKGFEGTFASRASRCTTFCKPSVSSRAMRPKTLSRKLDLPAMSIVEPYVTNLNIKTIVSA